MEENVNPEVIEKPPAPEGYYTDKKKKKADFWIGFVGSIVGNVLLALLYFGAMFFLGSGKSVNSTLPVVITGIISAIGSLLPWALNIAAIIIVLVKHRQWIAFGILASYGAALALAIIAGIALTIWCFASGITN